MTHRRKRLIDLDNLCIKAALDGIVRLQIIPDDSAAYIKEITHCQEKADVEETIIRIEPWTGK